MNGGFHTAIQRALPGRPRRAGEFAAGVLWFAACIHLQTAPSASVWGLFAAAILTGALLFAGPILRIPSSAPGHRLVVALGAPMVAFLAFNAFRHGGFLAWPLARAADLPSYLRLAYDHIVFAIALLAAVLWSGQFLSRSETGKGFWEKWRDMWGSWSGPWRVPLLLGAAMLWLWAFYRVGAAPMPQSGWVWAGFLAIALFKAVLTGVTEELCYRSLIQGAAVARFGSALGIIFQSILYAAFHMHLGTVMVGKPAFLLIVFAMGLCFGVVSQKTGGIGWACTVHIALDIMVEWSNVS